MLREGPAFPFPAHAMETARKSHGRRPAGRAGESGREGSARQVDDRSLDGASSVTLGVMATALSAAGDEEAQCAVGRDPVLGFAARSGPVKAGRGSVDCGVHFLGGAVIGGEPISVEQEIRRAPRRAVVGDGEHVDPGSVAFVVAEAGQSAEMLAGRRGFDRASDAGEVALAQMALAFVEGHLCGRPEMTAASRRGLNCERCVVSDGASCATWPGRSSRKSSGQSCPRAGRI